MYKYIVFWIIATWIVDPCPDAIRNPYNPDAPVFSTCLVNHGHYERDTLFRFFDTYEEAAEFALNGKDQTERIWIDSTLIPREVHAPSEVLFLNGDDTIGGITDSIAPVSELFSDYKILGTEYHYTPSEVVSVWEYYPELQEGVENLIIIHTNERSDTIRVDLRN